MFYIESTKNRIVKDVINLKSKKTPLFLAEGIRFVNDIPDDWEVEYIIATKAFLSSNDCDIKSNNIYCVTDEVFNKISGTVNPQGIMAVVKRKNYDAENFFASLVSLKNPPFLLALEKLSDPGNLGTIIRTADAMGVDGIFMSKGCVDLYSPKVLRATMGSVFHIPIFTEFDFSILLEMLKQNNIKMLAAHLDGKNFVCDADFKNSTAVFVGNEANGLSKNISDKCDELVKIPMLGLAESLNASVAASIIMYEVLRQRRFLM